MLGVLRHRGPDGEGRLVSGPFQAGATRLSINDPQGGGQPLWNADRSVALFYNGEIYNAPDLRRQLEADGVRFATRCDGEVVPHLYDRHGACCFEHLDGMFAAALWDARRQTLLLARDPAGEKPLYYTRLSHRELAFASELKALCQLDVPAFSLNRQALWDLPTFLWIPEPETVFEHVFAVPRGHVLVSTPDGIETRSYRPERAPRMLADDGEAVEEVRRVVTESIESRLLSDVPIGACLSGGLDSSIVASVARQRLGALGTFTIGLPEEDLPAGVPIDESCHAAQVAAQLGTRHRTVPISARDCREALPQFVRHGDQPFAVSSALGYLAIARTVRDEGIKVLLSGDCADECFGGYRYYLELEAGGTAEDDGSDVTLADVGLPRDERLARIRSYAPAKRAWAWHYHASEQTKARLFHPSIAAEVQSSIRHFARLGQSLEPPPEAFIRQDRDFYLPNEMLTKLDRMTMAHSVEGRAPFAARAVRDLVERLPFRHLVRDRTPKWALRRAFADRLPAIVLDRPKQGFNIPVNHWLRTTWADLVVDAFAPDSELVGRGVVESAAGAVADALARDTRRLHGSTLFAMVTLNLWLREVRSWR
jgi:asparagine synthase (glutamine-hydrolysing)